MNTEAKSWTADAVLGLARTFQPAAVLAAAADLDLFTFLAPQPATAEQAAAALNCDLRGLTVLLDALTALGLLAKKAGTFCLAPGLDDLLTPDGAHSVLAMAQHQANCLRRWAQLAFVVKTGHPAPDLASVRGEAGDLEAFIGAMHNISAPVADSVIQAIKPLRFEQLLDIGGASGTWTMAFLRACPSGRATLFDLPPVIPMAQKRLEAAGFLDRVRLVAGSYLEDELPPGADLAWVSAIVHQNSRAQNRELFARVWRALRPGGRIAIRDILMEPCRTRPEAGALFAVNMLVGTDQGATFTTQELSEDLTATGFTSPTVARQDPAMNAILTALKPAA